MATDPAFVGQNQTSEAQQLLGTFWQKQAEEIRGLTNNDFKTQELPLARIKKIMKLDEDVKMISAEAPVLFAKAAEIFVSELSLRAWVHTEDNKRRTLQRNDIAMAITKYDQFDFLIDIVPRDELKSTKRQDDNVQRASMMPDQVQYYFQLAQQHQQALQQSSTTTNTTTTTSQQPQQIQLQTGQVLQQPIQLQVAGGQTITLAQPGGASQAGAQVIQVQPQVAAGSGGAATAVSAANSAPAVASQQQTTQVYQQIVTANGEIQNIPMQLSPQEIQAITLQMAGKQPGQPIIIQTQAAGNQGAQQTTEQANGQQYTQATQPIFQVPLNIGGQQVYIQQNPDTDGEQGDGTDS